MLLQSIWSEHCTHFILHDKCGAKWSTKSSRCVQNIGQRDDSPSADLLVLTTAYKIRSLLISKKATDTQRLLSGVCLSSRPLMSLFTLTFRALLFEGGGETIFSSLFSFHAFLMLWR